MCNITLFVLVNFEKFDWASIFGTVESVGSMKRPQLRPLSAEIIELSIAKHSAGQLQYVGNSATGHDFIDQNNVRYECKSKIALFQQKSYFTKEIILSNFFGLMTDKIEQTFDHLILLDSSQNKVGIVSFTDATKCCKIRNSSITTRIPLADIKYVAQNITTTKKPNFEHILNNFILEAI